MHKRVGDNQVMLAVTSLVHSYCKHNPDCENNEAVMNITTYFEEIVSDSCEGTTDLNRVCKTWIILFEFHCTSLSCHVSKIHTNWEACSVYITKKDIIYTHARKKKMN